MQEQARLDAKKLPVASTADKHREKAATKLQALKHCAHACQNFVEVVRTHKVRQHVDEDHADQD